MLCSQDNAQICDVAWAGCHTRFKHTLLITYFFLLYNLFLHLYNDTKTDRQFDRALAEVQRQALLCSICAIQLLQYAVTGDVSSVVAAHVLQTQSRRSIFHSVIIWTQREVPRKWTYLLCNKICNFLLFNLNGAFTVYFVELLLIYEFKCPNYIFESFHNLVSGVPNNRFTCMRGQKTLSIS